MRTEGRRTLLLAFLLIAGCSHRTPYFRGDMEPPDVVAAGELLMRILLVGDAGEPGAAVLADVEHQAEIAPSRTLVAYLGDNMYPEGMTPSHAAEASVRLLPQIEAARRAGSRAIFIPGNHDWADGGERGYQAILAQGRYVRDELGEESFLPHDGCPGPVAFDLPGGVRIVALDTQWWLHAGAKPVGLCSEQTPGEVLETLRSSLITESHVVVLAHHPLMGFGRHAGFSEWREHVYHPIVGSLVAMVRKLAPRSQDYGSEAYIAMTTAFRGVLAEREPGGPLRIWASGHEHSLQVLEGSEADYLLVSGAGAKSTPVSDGEETLFAHSHAGFMVLDFLDSGRVVLEVFEPGEGVVFRMDLAS